MLASSRHFPCTPSCYSKVRDLPLSGSTAHLVPVLNKASELLEQMDIVFDTLRELTKSLTRSGRSSFNESVSFGKMCSALEHRLLHLKICEPPEPMIMLDYLFEACRLGALIYLRRVVKNLDRVGAILQKLKEQLKRLLVEGESKFVGDVDIQMRRGSFMWAVFMGGIVSLDEEEETWFAEWIVKLTKAWYFQGPKCWTDIEKCLRQINWADSLSAPECVSLWGRVEGICKRDMGQLEVHTTPTHRCLSCCGFLW